MKNYGAMVVFLSFVVYSILAGIYFGFESESQSILGKTVMSLGLMLVAFLLFVSFGSVLTFGSPWFFAIFLSALFAAEDTLIVSEAGKTLDEFVSDSEKQRP